MKLKNNVCFVLMLFVSVQMFGQNYNGDAKEIDKILKNIKNFSQYYMNAEYQNLADSYTVDGKIFPGKVGIIEGREAIKKRWTLPENVKVLHHKVTPNEISIVQNIAYDYGHYEGETLRANGSKAKFKGKYVIVWKKIDGDWKIYLDIWNSL